MRYEEKQYKNYIFDLYGTLIDIHTEEDKTQVWKELALFYEEQGASYTPRELKENFLSLVAEEQAGCPYEMYPEIKIEYVFQRLFGRKGVQADLLTSMKAGMLFRRLSTEYIRLYDGAKELLLSLKQHGKRIYLLSNAQEVFALPELKKLGIYTCFDDIFISSKYECRKPHTHLFEILLATYNLDIEQCLMIGNDVQTDIEGAKRVGMDSFYIHSNLSPDVQLQKLESTYTLMEMDLRKLKKILLNEK